MTKRKKLTQIIARQVVIDLDTAGVVLDELLTELREPNKEMRQAGEYAWMHRRLNDPESQPIRDCWQAMIDKVRKNAHPQ